MEEKIQKIQSQVNDMRRDVRFIRENHLAHIEKDIGDLKIQGAQQKTDLEWLKKNHWRVTVGIAMTLIASLIGVAMSYLTNLNINI